MTLAQEVINNFKKDEGREDIYKVLRKMDNPSWNSFMSDIQGELEKETKKIIPTFTLNKVMSKVVRR